MGFFAEYGIFLAKAITIVITILFTVGGIASISMRSKKTSASGHIEINNLNNELEATTKALEVAIFDKAILKETKKAHKKKHKQEQKERLKEAKEGKHKKRIYVLNFEGDIKASAVSSLREEITAILSIADQNDEVVLKINSSGGMVHTYGLAASQIHRIKEKNIPITVCVDKVAASGGYMMACVADKLITAPFAILGSIGVVAQLPNFNKLLKKNDIDYEILTAGKYKRTLTMFGENTEKGREKFNEELEDTHELFKDFVSENRPSLDIEQIATGEIWFGRRAIEKNLADIIQTSDDYLMNACQIADVYSIAYVQKKSLKDKLSLTAESTIDRVLLRWVERAKNFRFYS